MRNTPEAEQNAPLIKQASMALLNELDRLGVANNVPICLATIGSLMGCFAAASDNPQQALDGMNACARGILDGTLLD